MIHDRRGEALPRPYGQAMPDPYEEGYKFFLLSLYTLMKKTLSLFIAIFSLTLILSACGKKEGVGENKYGLSTRNNVVWWVAQDITNIVPYLAHDAAGQYASNLVWEPPH